MSIRKRLKAETPTFFKKLQKIAIAAVTVSGVIITLPMTLPVVFPAALVTAATYILTIGTAVGITSQLPVKYPNDIK